MKITGIQISSPYKFKNNLSSRDERCFINSQNTDNIAFKANVEKLNKAVFVQRNIIKQEDSLSRFVDRIFRKIYQHDHSKNYALYIHPKLKHFDDVSYEDIIPFIQSSNNCTYNPKHENMHQYLESLIPKGVEYQKQYLEATNKGRSKAYDILVQYGFIPE